MSGATKTPTSRHHTTDQHDEDSGPPSPHADIFRPMPPRSERERGQSPVKVHTSSAPLSAKEERALDKLAMLFTIQEERCLGEGGMPGREREVSQLSKASLTSSQLADDASFIYQHIDFQVLAKCVPGFVKTHLTRNGRYLPETFILRVNYWRRRRALGDDSGIKKGGKDKVVRVCTERGGPSPSPRVPPSSRSSRPPTVTSRQASSLS